MSGVIATLPKFQFSSATGAPLANGTLTVYVAGSTTPTNTWQDYALTTLNTNPVQLDSRGECVLWLDPAVSYKFLLKNAAGVTQWTQDNLSGAAPAGSLYASTGAALIGYMPAGTGAVATDVQAKLRESVSVKDFGATGITDDTVEIQKALDESPAYSVIEVFDHTIMGALIIEKPLTILSRGISTIEQTVWGAPVWIVAEGVSDVQFLGKHRQEYLGTRAYPITVPTSSDARIQTFYTSFAGSERIVCAGIAARGPNHNLRIDYADSFGFFCGVTLAGVNSNTLSDSHNVSIGTVKVDTTDWGVLIGGAVRDIHIETLIADNITAISPSDPSHAIYVGPRSGGAMYERVAIDNLLVNSCAVFTYGNNTSDAFSIRSCKNAWIGNLSIANSQLVGNARDDAKVVIDNLRGYLDATVVPTAGTLGALDAQSGASITVNDADIEFDIGVTGTGNNWFASAASTASLHILAGTFRNKSLAAGYFCRFGGVDLTIGAGVKIVWDTAPVNTAADNFGYLIHVYADPTGFAFVDQPYVSGSSKLFFIASGTTVTKWHVRLQPEKIIGGLISDTVSSGTSTYNVSYTSFARAPTLITAAATSVNLHGTNTVKTQNAGVTALAVFNRGTPGQQYLIMAGDAVTSITHGNFANGFVTTTGANIAVNTWSSVLAVFLVDRLHEISRTAK